MRQILQLLVLSLLFLISCDSKQGDFYVKCPSGWTIIDSVTKYSGRTVITYPPVKSKTSIFVENVSISISESRFVDIYIIELVAFLKTQALYFEQKGRGTLHINSYNIEWEQHLMKTKGSDLVEQRGYYFSKNGYIYQMFYTTKANEMSKYHREIDEMLKSFKIL